MAGAFVLLTPIAAAYLEKVRAVARSALRAAIERGVLRALRIGVRRFAIADT